MSHHLAIFDLDYTLTKRGTWGRFVWLNIRSKPWLWLPLFASAGWHQWRYKRGYIKRIEVKKSMMRICMQGKPRAELTAKAESFAANEVARGLRPGAKRELARLREQGHDIIIASAAADIVVAPIAKRLGIEHWVATDVKWAGEKALADFSTANCYGPEKRVRVVQLLRDHAELKQSDTIITFYSDSASDMPVFEYADKGVAVNPDANLTKLAAIHGYTVVDWNKD